MKPTKISDVEADGSVPPTESSSDLTEPSTESDESTGERSLQPVFDLSLLPPVVWLVGDYAKRFGHGVPGFVVQYTPEAELVDLLTKALATDTPLPGWEGQPLGCVQRDDPETLARLRRQREVDRGKS